MSDDYIKREDAVRKIAYANAYDLCAEYGQHFSCDKVDMDSEIENATKFLSDIPSADVAPVRHEEDGTLWVTVEDCEKVGRVIVKNEHGHFCRVFYMGDGDEEPVRHGKWNPYKWYIDEDSWTDELECSECGYKFGDTEYNYCPNCGAKMDEVKNAE